MYTECCKFGSVTAIVAPTAPSLLGSLAITFANDEAAVNCRNALDQRKFDGRVLAVVVIPSLPITTIEQEFDSKKISEQTESAESKVDENVNIEEVEQNVEDFLNSLL